MPDAIAILAGMKARSEWRNPLHRAGCLCVDCKLRAQDLPRAIRALKEILPAVERLSVESIQTDPQFFQELRVRVSAILEGHDA